MASNFSAGMTGSPSTAVSLASRQIPSHGHPYMRAGRNPLAECLGQRRQEPDRIGHDADMGEIENGCVLVGVDGKDQIGALDADAVLDGARYARRDIKFR